MITPGQGMSEVMSSSDIEDVLSSIRRLVTGDLRPRAPTTSVAASPEAVKGAAGAADQQDHQPTERLLLTPALRVVPRPQDVAQAQTQRPPIDGVLSLIGARVAPTGFEAETGDAFLAATEAAPLRPAVASAFTLPIAAVDSDEAQAAAVPQVPAEPASDPTHAAVLGSGNTIDADDPAPVVDLDEDTLRELIRDVLREELQGPMGERITRNIRKLVRAELARAVSLRQID